MAKRPQDDLAKIECVRSLFGAAEPLDRFSAEQIKTAIEFAVTGSHESPAEIDAFVEKARELSRRRGQADTAGGFCHLDIREKGYQPLWIREELIVAFKSLAGYPEAVLFVSGLKETLLEPGKYWTSRRDERYRKAVTYIEELAVEWTTRSTVLTIIIE